MDTMKTTTKCNDEFALLGGQVLFEEGDAVSAYQILTGEVLILRNGLMVDLIQAGELLDLSLWDGITAIAWTYCVFQPVPSLPQRRFQVTQPTTMDQHLHQTATGLN